MNDTDERNTSDMRRARAMAKEASILERASFAIGLRAKGFSNSAIANVLGVSESTVRKLVTHPTNER